VVQQIITDLATIDISPGGLVLREVAPGVSVAEVQAATGAPLEVPHEPPVMRIQPTRSRYAPATRNEHCHPELVERATTVP